MLSLDTSPRLDVPVFEVPEGTIVSVLALVGLHGFSTAVRETAICTDLEIRHAELIRSVERIDNTGQPNLLWQRSPARP